MLKLPSLSLTTPLVVPFSLMLAPATDTPPTSTILPLTLVCAKVTEQQHRKHNMHSIFRHVSPFIGKINLTVILFFDYFKKRNRKYCRISIIPASFF
jgi:hypothetical protein